LEVKELLKFARKATAEFIRQKGNAWSLTDQICHTHSEVSELYQILRHRGWPECKDEWIEEIWDIALSGIANAHIMGISDEELLDALQRVLNKVKERMKNKHYSVGRGN